MIKNIIFDWKRTLYDPEEDKLIIGAKEILKFIKNRNIPMILIGKGKDDMEDAVDRLGIRKYFLDIIFAEGDKDPKIFKRFLSDNPQETVVIGDRVRSELEISNQLGAITIWIKQGKFAFEEAENESQQPKFVVANLNECLNLLSRLMA
ncbi:MAG: HAD hydrolase-like protein [Patescibacteria group bacterium]